PFGGRRSGWILAPQLTEKIPEHGFFHHDHVGFTAEQGAHLLNLISLLQIQRRGTDGRRELGRQQLPGQAEALYPVMTQVADGAQWQAAFFKADGYVLEGYQRSAGKKRRWRSLYVSDAQTIQLALIKVIGTLMIAV